MFIKARKGKFCRPEGRGGRLVFYHRGKKEAVSRERKKPPVADFEGENCAPLRGGRSVTVISKQGGVVCALKKGKERELSSRRKGCCGDFRSQEKILSQSGRPKRGEKGKRGRGLDLSFPPRREKNGPVSVLSEVKRKGRGRYRSRGRKGGNDEVTRSSGEEERFSSFSSWRGQRSKKKKKNKEKESHFSAYYPRRGKGSGCAP